MTPETHHEAKSDTPARAPLASTSRRRLFKGLAGGTGVLLAVQAKTALGAGACRSPSAMMSGNTSPRPGNSGVTCSGGRSPGFWKVPQKFNFWPPGMTPATFNVSVSVCATGMQGLLLSNVLNPGTPLSTKFPGAPAFSFWQVLAFPNECGGQLLRHLAAAYLNSLAFTTPSAQYPLTPAQVVEMWTDLNANGVYCPGSMVAGCGSTGWNQLTVINYISGMYDVNSDLGADPDLCQT